MAPSARELQQDMSRFLSRIESDLRELARRQERAREDGSRWQEVQVVLARLQQHREHIRQRSGAKSIDKTAQTKLAAARAKIEEAARKARELEKRRTAHSPQQPSGPSTLCISPSSDAPSLGSTRSSERRCGSSSSSDGTEAYAEAESVEVEEVKVLAEQLVAGTDGDIMSEFVCKICQTHVVGCQPKLTRCSHLFCGDCISKWFAAQPGCQSWAGRAKGAGSVPCPVCKEPLHADKDLHPVCKDGQGGSAFLWQMLSATRIVCANHRQCNKEGRCDWEGDYGSYQQHIRSCSNVPCCGAALPPTSSLPADAEVVKASAAETFASSDVGDDDHDDHDEGQARAKAFPDTSCMVSSFGECEANTSETECEADGTALNSGAVISPASQSSEDASSIGDSSNPDCTTSAPCADVIASEPGATSEQAPDLYSLIAQLVELKASSEEVQPKQQPASVYTTVAPEDAAAPQFTEPVQENGTALEASAPQELPPAKPSSKSSSGKKSAAKSKDAKSKHSHEVAAAAQLQAQAAELRALQAQARVAQAAQAAYAAQWQAAWQMQAAQAMQLQQASMAYAGRMAQWQSAQKQAVQAPWGLQAAWAMQAGRR